MFCCFADKALLVVGSAKRTVSKQNMACSTSGFAFGDSDLAGDFAAAAEESEDESGELVSGGKRARKMPNILVTGTPGVGKTSFCTAMVEDCADKLQLTHLKVNEVILSGKLHTGRDEERGGCLIVDEDRLVDACEEQLKRGGCLVDSHLCDCWPLDWIDLVLVLRCDNTRLYDRLEERGYAQRKISENVEAEIMQVILDEAREVFGPASVLELRSDSIEDCDANLEHCQQWIMSWLAGAGQKEEKATTGDAQVDRFIADEDAEDEQAPFQWDPEIVKAFVGHEAGADDAVMQVEEDTKLDESEL